MRRRLANLLARLAGAAAVAALANALAPDAWAAAAPQQPPPAAASARRFAGVMEHGGALLGTGPGYRATFDARGVEFLPALGRRAAQAAPLRLQLHSVRRGDDVVWTAAAAAAPRRDHDRRSVAYHWPIAVERYEARPEGLEQSFRFDAPVAGRGDLVVRLTAATALPVAADGRQGWHRPGLGGVTVGAVTGIAADGARATGRVRIAADALELSLPGDFVDRAAHPLLLDPLLGAATEALLGADCDFPDTAYDAFSDTWCVVWTQFFGGGTTGVVGSVWRASDFSNVFAFAVNQPGDEDSVRVANIAGSGLFTMVWVNYAGNQSSISGLAFDPGLAQATTVWTLYGPGDVRSPVISGEATVYDDDCLIAWIDATYGLLGATVAIDPNLQVSATPVQQIAGGNATEPAFSKSGGNPGLHLLTWVDRPPGLPGWVRAQVVDHDFQLVGAAAWVQNAPEDSGWPAVDGDGFRFLVAFEQQETANPSGLDLRARLVTVGPTGITSLGGVLPVAAEPNDLDYGADVAILGDKFGIVWQAPGGGGSYGDDCWFRAFARNGAPIGAELRLDLTPGTTYRYEHAPRLCGERAGDPARGGQDGLVVFADQNVQTADSNVALQPVAAMGGGGAVVDLGLGCGPAGLAAATGPCALGNDTFRAELFGAPPLGVPFLLLAAPGPRTSCGVCTVLQPWAALFVPSTAGNASQLLPLPGDAALVGAAFEFQFALFQVAYVGCPTAPGAAASNIVRATLDY